MERLDMDLTVTKLTSFIRKHMFLPVAYKDDVAAGNNCFNESITGSSVLIVEICCHGL